MCIIAFCGWFLFVLFAGVGLAAIPRHISKAEIISRKKTLFGHVKRLMADQERLEKKTEKSKEEKKSKFKKLVWNGNTKLKRECIKFEAQTMLAEREFTVLEKSAKVGPWMTVF